VSKPDTRSGLDRSPRTEKRRDPLADGRGPADELVVRRIAFDRSTGLGRGGRDTVAIDCRIPVATDDQGRYVDRPRRGHCVAPVRERGCRREHTDGSETVTY
jgi:hypothetical protein